MQKEMLTDSEIVGDSADLTLYLVLCAIFVVCVAAFCVLFRRKHLFVKLRGVKRQVTRTTVTAIEAESPYLEDEKQRVPTATAPGLAKMDSITVPRMESMYADVVEEQTAGGDTMATAGSVEDNFEKETTTRVISWLRDELRLPQYVDAFMANGYDDMGIISKAMDKRDLEKIGVTKHGHQRMIMMSIREKARDIEGHGGSNVKEEDTEVEPTTRGYAGATSDGGENV